MGNDERANDAQAEYWEERAASWIGMEEYTTLVTGPFGRLAMDRLSVASGERVLDIGCGTGPTAVEMARRVAPGGAVRGVDISPSLIAAARERASRDGVDNVEFAVADAQTADLGAAAFDAVFSQFGVMFFSDPAEAFANLRRSVRDGGRIAFACWQAVTANEWMLVPGAAVVGVTGEPPPMPAPGEPGPFSLADPDHVEHLLTGSGFRSIDVVPHSVEVEVGADRVDMVVDASSSIGVVRDVIASSDDPSFHEQLRSAIRAALLGRVQGDTLRLGSAAFIVTAEASVT
jgi:SAM-dependent methyltransferase